MNSEALNSGKRRNALFFLLKKYAIPYRNKIATCVLLSILAAFCLPLTALVLAPVLHILTLSTSQPATDLASLTLNNLGPTIVVLLHLDPANTINIIFVVSSAYVLFSIAYAVLNFSGTMLAQDVRTRIAKDVVIDLHHHLLGLPLAFYHKMKAGDLISRYTQDAQGMANAINAIVGGIIQSSIQIVISVAVLFKTEPRLAVIAIVLGSGHFLITRFLGDRVRKKMLDQNVALGRLSSVLQETFLTMRVIKSFVAENTELERFTKEAEYNRQATLRFVFVKYIQDPLRFVADAVVVAVILFFTYQSMRAGRLSLEGFGLFIVLARQVIAPISSLAAFILGSAAMMGSAQRVVELMVAKNEIRDGTRVAPPFKKSLELRHVSFHYNDGQPVLQDINVVIHKGETVAVVGASGVGKSTLIDIILRLSDPCKGNVRMDGTDVQKYTQESYRRQFGIVPQECLLFNDTVRNNILFGRPEFRQRLEQAIETANATDFISQLPQGLDTELGDRGVRLSGGQRQRIAIARAVYGDPSILVLDEATSSLDTESEMMVQDAIEKIIRMRTAIVIAHRLSTVRFADMIIVLKDGSVEQVGRHDELYHKSRTYARLCDIQLSR